MTESTLYGLQWGSQGDNNINNMNNMELEKSNQKDGISTSFMRFVFK